MPCPPEQLSASPRPALLPQDAEAGLEMLVLNPLTRAGWDELVASHPQGCFFHGSAWASVLAATYGFEPCYVTLLQQGRLIGLFPFMEVRDLFGRRSGVCLPFTDECAPILPEGPQGRALLAAALDLARARRWRRIEWRGGGPLFGAGHPAVQYVTHSLNLDSDGSAVLRQFSPAAQRAVRKAESSGVEIHLGESPEAVERYYALHCLTRRRHGLPPQPRGFFHHIHRHVLARGLGFVAEAFHQGLPVAAAVFFTFGRSAIYKFGASDRERQELRANNLLFARALERLAALGIRCLSLGRTSLDNDGLRRFKRGLGGHETSLECFAFDPARQTYLTGRDDASGWHNELFRHMPLCLSRLAGQLLYRYAA